MSPKGKNEQILDLMSASCSSADAHMPRQRAREVIAVQEDNAVIARQAVCKQGAMVYQELKFSSKVVQAPLQFIACRQIMGKTPRKTQFDPSLATRRL
eukprot:3728906-Amphidinium_carterae.1